MERLTYRTPDGSAEIDCDKCRFRGSCSGYGRTYDCVTAAAERLALYEDAAQVGRLLVFPCGVGDTVFDIFEAVHNGGEEIRKIKVTDLKAQLDKRGRAFIVIGGYLFAADDFGKTAFLKYGDAEKALKGGGTEWQK